jgi:hypothetical protein
MVFPSARRVFEAWSALMGVWGSSYITFLDELGPDFMAVSETLQWPFLIIGVMGTGSAIFSSWKIARQRSQGLYPSKYR